MYSVIIKNGKIADGTGKKCYTADIGIKDERIAFIGDLSDEIADKIIDAKGKLVTPGFIDAHSHADLNLLLVTENLSLLHQGITTVIGGNCGTSPGPLNEVKPIDVWDSVYIPDIKMSSYFEIMPSFVKTKEYFEGYKKALGKDITYSDMTSLYKLLEKETFTTNYYPLIGHNNLRTYVMGEDARRKATPEEIEKMKIILDGEMKAGANGMSTGLDYPPGAFSDTEELLELADVLKENHGIYASHVRGRKLFTTGEGGYDLFGGLEEVKTLAKQKGIRVHVSHFNTPPNKETEALEFIDEMVKDGLDVSIDVIANVVAGGMIYYRLMTLLQPWYKIAGNVEQFKKNLDDPDYWQYTKENMRNSKWFYTNEKALPGIENAVLITQCEEKSYENKTVMQIMKEMDWDYQETLLQIAKADPYTYIKYGGAEQDPERFKLVKQLMDHSLAMPSSDVFASNFDTVFGGIEPLEMIPHQNAFCVMIHYLKNLASDDIETTIHKATGFAAQRFNLVDRGTLELGNYADILIIDEDNLHTNEQIKDTRVKPSGIDYVIINGQLCIEKSEFTGNKPGKVLLKK